MRNLLDYLHKVRDWLRRRDISDDRCEQIIDAVFFQRAQCFNDIADLPDDLRELLNRSFRVFTTDIANTSTRYSAGDHSHTTQTLSLVAQDQYLIRCWLISEANEVTAVLSSHSCGKAQAGETSGNKPSQRKLSGGEIIEQLLRLQALLTLEQNVTRVEIAGDGEPLANLDDVLRALSFISEPNSLTDSSSRSLNMVIGIAPSGITIATGGRPAAIRRLARLACPYRLAWSCHLAGTQNPTIGAADETVCPEALIRELDFFAQACAGGLQVRYELAVGDAADAHRAEVLATFLSARPTQVPLQLVSAAGMVGRESDFMAVLERHGVPFEIVQTLGTRSVDPQASELAF